MAKKIRVTRKQVMEFEPNPNWYEEGSTIEEMVQAEKESIANIGADEYFELGIRLIDDVSFEIVEG